MSTSELASTLVVDEVTRLYPVRVAEIVAPRTLEEIVEVVKSRPGPLSVGGGRYSMGGQTACAGGTQIDMRSFDRILDFSPTEKRITVQTGCRWRDIQAHIDGHDLSIRIMQTYSNFTVGGSLSVNVHGRYVGMGPLILSVAAIKVVLADGSIVAATPRENAEIFYGCIGGYGGLGVIVEATLDLADNVKVARQRITLPFRDYRDWFFKNVRGSADAVFHNGDIYPPRYDRVSAVTWSRTDEPVTVKERLIPRGRPYHLERIVLFLVCTLHFGKQYRQYLIDPQVYREKRVHWRNYEASYDVAELEPRSRERSTFVLQEYFVPVDRLSEFVPKMAGILRRFRVNAVNVSIRHAKADPGSLLAWAKEEVFALVLYYKQGTKPHQRDKVAVWTRELIDAVLAVGGSYYLPYQPHATSAQFRKAYPRAGEYFALKARLDPGHKFRNTLWNTYYDPAGSAEAEVQAPVVSSFKAVFSRKDLRDGFYRFLQNIYRLFPEHRFHRLIAEACEGRTTDEEIYAEVQRRLPAIAPFLAPLRYALPALTRQQKEIARETAELLTAEGSGLADGYAEIGTAGRYITTLRSLLGLTGPTYLVSDVQPGMSPPDIMERRGLRKPWDDFAFLPNYEPIPVHIPEASVGLATMYVGLHHSPLDRLDAFVDSIRRILKPGGRFVLRDHDVDSPAMEAMVNLAHDVFNAGLGVPWETNAKELRLFRTVAAWESYLASRGFQSAGKRIFQEHDPTRNALLLFTKV
jgi:FAD/FMN-containing dehydrogenase/SAM-dependent methyltransferase